MRMTQQRVLSIWDLRGWRRRSHFPGKEWRLPLHSKEERIAENILSSRIDGIWLTKPRTIRVGNSPALLRFFLHLYYTRMGYKNPVNVHGKMTGWGPLKSCTFTHGCNLIPGAIHSVGTI